MRAPKRPVPGVQSRVPNLTERTSRGSDLKKRFPKYPDPSDVVGTRVSRRSETGRDTRDVITMLLYVEKINPYKGIVYSLSEPSKQIMTNYLGQRSQRLNNSDPISNS